MRENFPLSYKYIPMLVVSFLKGAVFAIPLSVLLGVRMDVVVVALSIAFFVHHLVTYEDEDEDETEDDEELGRDDLSSGWSNGRTHYDQWKDRSRDN